MKERTAIEFISILLLLLLYPLIEDEEDGRTGEGVWGFPVSLHCVQICSSWVKNGDEGEVATLSPGCVKGGRGRRSLNSPTHSATSSSFIHYIHHLTLPDWGDCPEPLLWLLPNCWWVLNFLILACIYFISMVVRTYIISKQKDKQTDRQKEK